MRRGTRPKPHELRWLTASEMAVELGLTYTETLRLLHISRNLLASTKLPRITPKTTLYPTEAVEILRALLGQKHRAIEPPGKDWLSRYLKNDE